MSHLRPRTEGPLITSRARQTRRHRALRIFLMAVIAAAVLLLAIITGAALAHGGVSWSPAPQRAVSRVDVREIWTALAEQ